MSDLKHLAIIMDGNRRWAKKNGMPTAMGHQEGYKRFKEICDLCYKKGIKTLTVYAFSTENWKRDESEVNDLMNLMKYALRQETERLHKENIRVKIIGRRDNIGSELQDLIAGAENTTKENTGGNINIAFSYGGREELTNAVKQIVKSGLTPEQITEDTIEKNLYTAGQEDPELLIRCGGQNRLSNFLLWQSAYTEIYFSDVLWPDFDPAELEKALEFFNKTKRNFGK